MKLSKSQKEIAEKNIEKLYRQHQIMSRLTERRDADSCDMQLIFDELIQAVHEGLGVSRTSIWLCNDDFSKILCACAYSELEGFYDILDEIEVSDCPGYIDAVESGVVVQDQSVENDKAASELIVTGFVPEGTNALLHLPIWVEGERIGFFCCDQVSLQYRWTETDQEFVRSVANHVARSS